MIDPKNTFFMESRELLDVMESSLLELEKNSVDKEAVNAVFRAVHTIKGNSGMFSLEYIERFSHLLENLLDRVRKDLLGIDGEMTGLLLECRDFLDALLDHCEEHPEDAPGEEMHVQNESLAQRLNAYLGQEPVTAQAGAPAHAPAARTNAGGTADACVENDCWHISIRFGKDVFKDGLDPFPFMSYLGGKGEIASLVPVTEGIPAGDGFDPEICYLGFEIDFRGDIDKKGIESVFEFVRDDCVLRILPPHSAVSEYVKLIQELPETPMLIGEILKQVGTLTDTELALALDSQEHEEGRADGAGDKKLVGDIMVDQKMVHQPVLDAALEKQNAVRRRDDRNSRFIRIDADKLDKLINLIGELVITGSNVKQIANSETRSGLVEAVSVMSRLIEEIRDSTMNVRMVQIGETFAKYERVVRDLSRDNGKKVNLVINGGDTELDKTLIDKISDPLMHLVRNAVDHGIGRPEDRVAKGKPEAGTVTLNAYHETGSIIIEVNDDGNGLSRERIFDKAVESGLLAADAQISDYDLFQYIFEPGFSTAEKVTNISGRGVGMDVVRRNIESLRGTVDLTSTAGQGTSIRLHLPLTLAIIDGFMVKIGESHYVLPLDMVTECTEVQREEINSKEGGNYINLRGDVLPFLRLRNFFNEDGEEPERPKVVVVEYSHKKAGLVVDSLIGELQTVIKPLGKIFSKLQWISGSTILGTGEVAYILDVPKLIQHMQANEYREARAS